MKRAFTIVETLIVVLAIGILAALITVAYRGITNSATEATMRSDLTGTADNISLYLLKNKVLPDSSDNEAVESEGNSIYYVKESVDKYCVMVTSQRLTKSLKITESGDIKEGTCAAGWKTLATGYRWGCAVASNDRTYCWGGNNYGQLGDGTVTDRSVPTLVQPGDIPAGVTITQVAGGTHHTCALGSDGNAYCWGYNFTGMLGDGTKVDKHTPTAVQRGAIPAGVTLTQVVTGQYYSCALGSNQAVYCWGHNNYGQLGDGTVTQRLTPVALLQGAIPSGVKIKEISGGNFHVCAIATNDKMYCWGSASFGNGQLGDGTIVDKNLPVEVLPGSIPSGAKPVQVTAGPGSTCSVASSGALYCWGGNAYGQLGSGTTVSVTVPVSVQQGAIHPSKVNTRKKLPRTLGAQHACAAVESAGVYCWGRNDYGQLGINNLSDSLVPVRVGGLMATGAAKELALGLGFSCSLNADGQIYCWGRNNNGQLGNNSTTDRLLPVKVQNPF